MMAILCTVYVGGTANAQVYACGSFITAWGAETGLSNFDGPRDVEVGLTGDVYVVFRAADGTQVFTPSGTLLTSWGTAGSGPGQFDGPSGIASSPAGDVYATDTGNNRIQRFTSAGVYLGEWGAAGTGLGQFDRPIGVAVSPLTGDVYVTDSFNHRVQRFTSTGTPLMEWGAMGAAPGQFVVPGGVAVGPDGSVYVADLGNDRVQKFDPNGVFLLDWGTSYSVVGNGFLPSPGGIDVSGDGEVYVLDTSRNDVQKFDEFGAYITRWGGSHGDRPGGFSDPEGIAVGADGVVYVADYDADRVQSFGCRCPETPLPFCKEAQKIGFKLSKSTDRDKVKLKWQWIRGDVVEQADLGDPTAATRYDLCVYDSSGGVPSLTMSLGIADSDSVRWQDKSPKGWKYKADANPVRKLALKTGEANRSKVTLLATGSALAAPNPASESRLFAVDTELTVQMLHSGGECWTSEFTSFKKNEVDKFEATRRRSPNSDPSTSR